MLSQYWDEFPTTYREKEIRILASWIEAGVSGSVISLPGFGRATLLGFLCQRPDVLKSYLAAPSETVVLIPIDLNNIPNYSLATFYRVILRSFYEYRESIEHMENLIVALYQKSEFSRDPFVSQSSLRELLLAFQRNQIKVVLIFNRFDKFCQSMPPHIADSLRGLRDSFKESLSYILGMSQDVEYLSNIFSPGTLYEILDTHTCWVGPLNRKDAEFMVTRETLATSSPPTKDELRELFYLSGGVPSLIKVACRWWMETKKSIPPSEWVETLLDDRSVKHRISQIWKGLTQDEQLTASNFQTLLRDFPPPEENMRFLTESKQYGAFKQQYKSGLENLSLKGVVLQSSENWRLFSPLFSAYLRELGAPARGKVWFDPKTKELFQGTAQLDNLAPLERSVLHYLISYPRVRNKHTDLIYGAWPEDVSKEGVTTEALYQVIRGLRKKIEPNPSEPIYLVNWRGYPEGGYQFFPEGRPQADYGHD